MISEYPYEGQVILLNDTLFKAYGGKDGSTTAFQRQAAYAIAEEEISRYIGALLQTTIVSGTYLWTTNTPIQLDWGYIHGQPQSVVVQSNLNVLYNYSTTDIFKCVLIRNAKRGLLDILLNPLVYRTTTYPYSTPTPYTIALTYECGMPSGTATCQRMMLALTMAAQITLNEIDSAQLGVLANEAPGGIGVQQYTNELYQEVRVKLGRHAWGSNPQADMIYRLVAPYVARRAMMFH